jgi:hypothetical protein
MQSSGKWRLRRKISDTDTIVNCFTFGFFGSGFSLRHGQNLRSP